MELTCHLDLNEDGQIGGHESDLPHAFGWDIELDETDEKDLLRGRFEHQNAYVELRGAGRDVKLWPFLIGKKKQEMEIHLQEGTSTILIELKELTPAGSTVNEEVYREKTNSFLCDLSGFRGVGDRKELLYKGGSDVVFENLFGSIELFPMRVSLSLDTCSFRAGEEKAECSLKVTT